MTMSPDLVLCKACYIFIAFSHLLTDGFCRSCSWSSYGMYKSFKTRIEKPFISQFDTLIAFHHLEFKCSYIDVRNHLKIKFSLWEIVVGDWFKKKTSMLQ